MEDKCARSKPASLAIDLDPPVDVMRREFDSAATTTIGRRRSRDHGSWRRIRFRPDRRYAGSGKVEHGIAVIGAASRSAGRHCPGYPARILRRCHAGAVHGHAGAASRSGSENSMAGVRIFAHGHRVGALGALAPSPGRMYHRSGRAVLRRSPSAPAQTADDDASRSGRDGVERAITPDIAVVRRIDVVVDFAPGLV
jgi:hypothetical protein